MASQAHHRQGEVGGESAYVGRRCHRGKRYGTRRAGDGRSRRYRGGVPPTVPQIPPRLTDPRPVLAVGVVLWAIATVVVWVIGSWAPARPICLMGLVVGLLAYGIFALQRRSARRGDKGAQKGL
ncbi:DUF2530 domain-containing protein [Nocardia terpenica]|uniref:DUF2530 domain-containing protein n=1 Tax=Nocardia terpenica TaxID=455432 RepID=A0A6G9YW22_9NOCA|nr:DUF2530 domain-containing protein [Nocardia terpenica]